MQITGSLIMNTMRLEDSSWSGTRIVRSLRPLTINMQANNLSSPNFKYLVHDLFPFDLFDDDGHPAFPGCIRPAAALAPACQRPAAAAAGTAVCRFHSKDTVAGFFGPFRCHYGPGAHHPA